MNRTLIVLMLSLIFISFSFAQEVSHGDPYPLDTCLVSGKKLDSMGKPIVYVHEKREIRFCCQGCVPKFKKDVATYLSKLDKTILDQQLPIYPMNTCIVSGEKMGKMGEPISYIYQNRLVRFCCKGCLPKFAKSPSKYLSKLDKAVIARQLPSYPLNTCVVSGEKLGNMGKPIDMVYGNRLVRFCCKGCIKKYRLDPPKYLGKLAKEHHDHGENGDHNDHGDHDDHGEHSCPGH